MAKNSKNIWKSCNKWSEQQKKEQSKKATELNQNQNPVKEAERRENIIKNFKIMNKNQNQTPKL